MIDWQKEIADLRREEEDAVDNIVGWATVFGFIVLLYFVVSP